MPSLGHPNSRVQSFLHTQNRFTFWEKPLKFHSSLPFSLSSSKSKTPGAIQSSPSSLGVAKLPASQTPDILLLVDKAYSLAPKFFDWLIWQPWWQSLISRRISHAHFLYILPDSALWKGLPCATSSRANIMWALKRLYHLKATKI